MSALRVTLADHERGRSVGADKDLRPRVTDGGFYWCATCDHNHLMHWGTLNTTHGCRVDGCPCQAFVALRQSTK